MNDIQLQLEEKIKLLDIPNITQHIFLCCDQTKPKCCQKELSLQSWDYLKTRLKALNLTDHIHRTKANCLRVCSNGPIMVIYPDGVWYHSCSPEVIEQIIQKHILQGNIVEKFFLAKSAQL